MNNGLSRGQGSFSIPHAAHLALLDAGASAYDICTYLCLARYTDRSGQFSSAGISAVSRATGASKAAGSPLSRSLAKLKQIFPPSKAGGPELPIVLDRQDWQRRSNEALPDGPTERGRIRFVLPSYDEPPESRIWIANSLVSGTPDCTQPLKALRDSGDVAARLLLYLYAAHDMETWGGVRPTGPHAGFWRWYDPLSYASVGVGATLLRARAGTLVWAPDRRVGATDEECWVAFEALLGAGLFYEVVMVINRAPCRGADGFATIPIDAEPVYELGTRGARTMADECGVGWATARTAGELKLPVTAKGGHLDGTYAAFARTGRQVMVSGIFRARFRVANRRNAGVVDAWSRIMNGQAELIALLNEVRRVARLDPIKWNPDAA